MLRLFCEEVRVGTGNEGTPPTRTRPPIFSMPRAASFLTLVATEQLGFPGPPPQEGN